MLRHTYAVGLLKKGIDIRTIQRLLGHARITTTEKYLKITNVDIDETVRQVNLGW